MQKCQKRPNVGAKETYNWRQQRPNSGATKTYSEGRGMPKCQTYPQKRPTNTGIPERWRISTALDLSTVSETHVVATHVSFAAVSEATASPRRSSAPSSLHHIRTECWQAQLISRDSLKSRATLIDGAMGVDDEPPDNSTVALFTGTINALGHWRGTQRDSRCVQFSLHRNDVVCGAVAGAHMAAALLVMR
jgi:hypothetical protein